MASIEKKIRNVMWVLAVPLLAVPALDYFGVSPQYLYHNIYKKKTEEIRQKITSAEVDRIFGLGATSDIQLPPPVHAPAPSSAPVPAAASAFVPPPLLTPPPAYAAQPPAEKPAAAPSSAQSSLTVPKMPAPPAAAWLPPPPDFMTLNTRNILMYRQFKPITSQIEEMFKWVRGVLMLELTPFTLIKPPDKKLVMMFATQEAYMQYTDRKDWSAAVSDIASNSLFIYEAQGFYPLSLHEMTHLFFDGYFWPDRMPLWVSEGMAMYTQVTVSGETPPWIDYYQGFIKQGYYIKLKDFVNIASLQDQPAENVFLWYTQAYSLVKYLMTQYSKDNFHNFCENLRDKSMPQSRALYRAYGLPFTQFDALESVWLNSVKQDASIKEPEGIPHAAAPSSLTPAAGHKEDNAGRHPIVPAAGGAYAN